MAKSGTLSEDIMDFFRQLFEKSPDGVPDDASDFRFLDKLLKMKVTREKLGVFAALAVSTSVFFFYYGRPRQKPGGNPKTTKGILKTRASQTIDADRITAAVSVSGCTPTIHISSPEASLSAPCCAHGCEQPSSSANVEEHPAGPVEVQPERRHCAVLASWTSRSARPSYSVSFTGGDEGVKVNGNGRKKKVTFSKSVVEPSGDNDAYRRNYRSATNRQVGKGRRNNHADNIARNGDFPQKTNENSTSSSAISRQPCHPDSIRTSIDDFEPQQTGEKQVSEKGCRHTRTTDTSVTPQEAHYPLRQQDRNRMITGSSDDRHR